MDLAGSLYSSSLSNVVRLHLTAVPFLCSIEFMGLEMILTELVQQHTRIMFNTLIYSQLSLCSRLICYKPYVQSPHIQSYSNETPAEPISSDLRPK